MYGCNSWSCGHESYFLPVTKDRFVRNAYNIHKEIAEDKIELLNKSAEELSKNKLSSESKIFLKDISVAENIDDIANKCAELKKSFTDDGLVKTFTVTKSASFSPNVYLSFTMTLTAFPAGLAHQSLKWEFVSVGSGETTLGSGNLASASQGDSIKLLTSPATRHQLGSTTNTYKLYIWIDGTQSNPSSMQNQGYTFTITIDGTDNASAGL